MKAAPPCWRIHIGTVGMEGEFDAIDTDEVDLNGARDNSCDIQRGPTA
jgi:hypothetical protein